LLNEKGPYGLPIVRLGGGKYLIGNDLKMVAVRNGNCLVRIGGGYQTLASFLDYHDVSECMQLSI